MMDIMEQMGGSLDPMARRREMMLKMLMQPQSKGNAGPAQLGNSLIAALLMNPQLFGGGGSTPPVPGIGAMAPGLGIGGQAGFMAR